MSSELELIAEETSRSNLTAGGLTLSHTPIKMDFSTGPSPLNINEFETLTTGDGSGTGDDGAVGCRGVFEYLNSAKEQ